MLQPNRHGGENYRYSFNGKEGDNEVKGFGNQIDFGFRSYDPRLGRFLSLDPDRHKYPFMSPYCYAANSPIMFIDYQGRGPIIPDWMWKSGYYPPMLAGFVNAFGETVVGTVEGVTGFVGSAYNFTFGGFEEQKRQALVVRFYWDNRNAIMSTVAEELKYDFRLIFDPELMFTKESQYFRGKMTFNTLTMFIGVGEIAALLKGTSLVKTFGNSLYKLKSISGKLSIRKFVVTNSGLENIKKHLSRDGFDHDVANDVMLDRLEKIKEGKLEATEVDMNFYDHELTEQKYMAEGMDYDSAHEQTLKDQGIEYVKGYQEKLYTKEALKAGDEALEKAAD